MIKIQFCNQSNELSLNKLSKLDLPHHKNSKIWKVQWQFIPKINFHENNTNPRVIEAVVDILSLFDQKLIPNLLVKKC